MGRPPSNGVPAFRFTKAEVAVMETMIQENNNTTPDLEVLEALAKNFSESEDRKGKVAVQTKQVWQWFQNRKHAIRAKSKESTSKISSPARFLADEITEMENILQEHNNAMPPYELLIDLAKKFSEAPDRKGYTVVEGKQVCNWFRNRRHGVYAKSGDKFDVSSISLDEPTLMTSVPQGPQLSNAPLPAPMPMPIPVPDIERAPALGLSRKSSAGLKFPSLKAMLESVSVPGHASTPVPALASTSSDVSLPTSIPVPVLSAVFEPASAPAIASNSSESLLLTPVLVPATVHASASVPASASGPTPALNSPSVLAVRRALRKICENFEAKSSQDGAWHIVASFLSYRYPVIDDMEALVHFADFGEEGEWVNVRKHVRLRSLTNQPVMLHCTARKDFGLGAWMQSLSH